MSKAIVTSADLDEIAELAEALEVAASDQTVALYVLDHDEETSELLIQFTVDAKTHNAWFSPKFLRETGMSARLSVM